MKTRSTAPALTAVSAAVLILVTSHSQPALAQTGKPSEATLPTMQVKAAAEQPSAQEQKVDTQRLKRTLASDLQDVFDIDPSVYTGTGSRNGQKVFLRGMDDLNLNVQIDGARQGANLFHHQGRVNVDPFLLKRVTVNAGPAPADGGPGALGGSVKFETVDAQDLLKPGQTAGGRLGVQFESADHLKSGVGSAYGLVGGKVGLLAYTRHQLNDNVRAGGGETLPSTEGTRGSHLFKISVLEQDGHSLWASAERNTNEGGYLRANMPWQTNNATQALDDQLTTRDTLSLRHRYRPKGNDLIDLQTTVYTNDSQIELYGPNPTGGSRGGLWLTRSSGGDIRNTFNVSTGHWVHALTVGLDHFKDNGISDSPADPRLSETATNTGLYLQDRIEIENIRLSAGVRVDRYRTRYANAYRTEGTETSPNFSAEWDLLDSGSADLTVFAGVGQSIRGGKLNQAGWLTKYFLPPSYTVARPFTLSRNGILNPEVGQQKQWGVKWHDHGVLTEGDHAGAEIAFFNTRIKDYQVVPGEGAGGVTDTIFNAPGNITSRGFEIRSHWGTQQWLVNATYSHSTVRNYDGQPMDTTGDSARVGVSVGDRLVLDTRWKLSPQWQLGHTFTAVKQLKDVPAGRPEKPGYSVHGLQAVWLPQGNDSLTVTLGVDNLFDKFYAHHATTRVTQASTTATAVKGRVYATPEPGRRVKVALDWRF